MTLCSSVPSVVKNLTTETTELHVATNNNLCSPISPSFSKMPFYFILFHSKILIGIPTVRASLALLTFPQKMVNEWQYLF